RLARPAPPRAAGDERRRPGGHGARQPLPRRPARRRHATLEVPGQPRPDHAREPRLRPGPERVPHRLPRLQPRAAHRRRLPGPLPRPRVPPGVGRGGRRRALLTAVDYRANSDDFVFDQELVAQVVAAGLRIAEIAVPTRYFAEASSVNFRRSVVYGLGTLRTLARYRSARRLEQRASR